jgi:hypothetical protein
MLKPQSKPVVTSLASSLKRLSEPSVASELHNTVANDAYLAVALDFALTHDCTGNCADLGNMISLHALQHYREFLP